MGKVDYFLARAFSIRRLSSCTAIDWERVWRRLSPNIQKRSVKIPQKPGRTVTSGRTFRFLECWRSPRPDALLRRIQPKGAYEV